MKLMTNLLMLSALTLGSAFAVTAGELNSLELDGPRASMKNPQVRGNVKVCGWSKVLMDNERFTHEKYGNAFPISATESVIETLVELVAESPDMEVCGEGVYQETYGFAGRTLRVHLTSIQ